MTKPFTRRSHVSRPAGTDSLETLSEHKQSRCWHYPFLPLLVLSSEDMNNVSCRRDMAEI